MSSETGVYCSKDYDDFVNTNPIYVAIEDLENKDSTKVYRIWDTSKLEWYRSNSRSVWLTLSGARCALGHATNRSESYGDFSDRYQIKIFNLTPEV